MCTNALLLKEKLHLFTPSKYLSFSVHLDGEQRAPRVRGRREGGYDIAMEGIRAAVAAGFRVTTNTTLFDGADPNSTARAVRSVPARSGAAGGGLFAGIVPVAPSALAPSAFVVACENGVVAEIRSE